MPDISYWAAEDWLYPLRAPRLHLYERDEISGYQWPSQPAQSLTTATEVERERDNTPVDV